MTCPRCGTKTRSKRTVCPTCGHRPRRLKWLAIPTIIALIAFISILTYAYLEEVPRSTESLADKVNLNIGDDTVSADNATTIDLSTLEKSLFSVGAGTGFLVSPQDILTAAHNVEGLTTITIDHDGKKLKGTVVGRTVDIAVIRINQVKETPFMFSHAIAASDETLVTLMPSKRIEGRVTFDETGYKREFDIPRKAIGSPIVASDGRVLAMHLKSRALPVAMFEQDVLEFLKSDTPAPPLAKLAPVAPITPSQKEETVTEPAPAPAPAPTPEPTPQPEAETPAPEAAPEPAAPAEEPVEAAPAAPEETPEPEVVEPEVPAEEATTPPVTEEPAEPEPPVTEPAEPVAPEKPAAEAEKPVQKQDTKPKEPAKEKPVKEEKPVTKDKPAQQEKQATEKKPAKEKAAETPAPSPTEADDESTSSD